MFIKNLIKIIIYQFLLLFIPFLFSVFYFYNKYSASILDAGIYTDNQLFLMGRPWNINNLVQLFQNDNLLNFVLISLFLLLIIYYIVYLTEKK